jgi:hypothetical protein
MNRLKNEREKKKNVKNTSQITRIKFLPNLRGHKEDSGPPFPHEFLVLTLITWISGPLSHTSNKGGGNPNKDERKMQKEEVREMGAPSSYLTGLLHNPSFTLGYN